MSAGGRGKVVTLAGIALFGGVMFSVPFLVVRKTPGMQTKDESLTGSQVMRGPFMNTGSKDAGPDPDWQDGTYKGRRPTN